MTPAQNKRFWNNRRDDYRKKHLKYTIHTTKSGYEYTKFNYLHKKAKEKLDELLHTLQKNGFSKNDLIQVWHNKTGLLAADIKKYFSGEKELSLWEFFLALESFEIDYKMVSELATKYSSSIERDKIILQSKGILYFVVKININDYLDFEVEFSSKKKQALSPKITRYENEVIKILKWYFVSQAGKSTLPFKVKEFKELFRQKWYRKEMGI